MTEFKASLVYISRSRPVEAPSEDSVKQASKQSSVYVRERGIKALADKSDDPGLIPETIKKKNEFSQVYHVQQTKKTVFLFGRQMSKAGTSSLTIRIQIYKLELSSKN